MFFRKLAVRCTTVLAVAVLSACGGGGGGGTSPTTPTNPVTKTYTVSTRPGDPVSFSPTSVVVESGKTASITVELKQGYVEGAFEGCGAKLALNAPGTAVFVTGSITSDCLIIGSAAKAPVVSKVSFTSSGGEVSNFAGTEVLSGKTVEVKPGDSIEAFLVPSRGYQLNNRVLTGSCVSKFVGTSTVRITPTSDCNMDVKFALSDLNFNSTPDKDEANFIIRSIEVTPKGMRESDVGKMDIVYTVDATGNQGIRADGTIVPIAKVAMRTIFRGVGVAVGDLEELVQLYDDGTHGDAQANDAVYTASVRPTGFVDRFNTMQRGQARMISSTLVLFDGAGNELRSFEPGLFTRDVVTLLLKDSVPLAAPPVKVADNIYRSQNYITIVDPTYHRRDDEQWATRTAAKYVSGTFDVVAKFNYGATFGDNWAHFGRVKQFASGIGIGNEYDVSADYGLPGICGIISFGSSILSGYPFNHEFGHCWSAYLVKPELPLARNTGHWTMASEALSLMGQNGLSIAGGPGNWKGASSSTYDTFSLLDLYLGGMADVGEIPPMYYHNDTSMVNIPTVGTSIPDSKVSYMTSADLVRVYGARSPAYDGKQKNFRLLTIVIASKPLSSAEHTLMELILANIAGNSPGKYDGDVTPPGFSVACRNRCTLSTDIGAPTVKTAEAHAKSMSLPVNLAVPQVISGPHPDKRHPGH